MKKLRTAVIGTGHLGKFHARVLSVLENSDFQYVVDVDEEKGKEIAMKYGVSYINDYRKIFNKVDAVTIATPTVYHYDIASDFLENGIHVLVEKPITDRVEDAEELIRLAEENNVKLQVGHIERFNRSFAALKKRLKKPGFIRTFRMSPFTGRSVDIDVILDLMIHDVDLIFSLVDSPVKRITAKGIKVLTQKSDMGYALIEFENGCLAEINVSRVSEERERTIRVFDGEAQSYFSADLNNRQLNNLFYDKEKLHKKNVAVEDRDQLEAEIGSFLDAILNNTDVMVTGQAGLKALKYTKIISEMAENNQCFREF